MSVKKRKPSSLYSVYPFGDTYCVYSSDFVLNKKLELSGIFTLFAILSKKNKEILAKVYMYEADKCSEKRIKNLKEFEKLVRFIKQ